MPASYSASAKYFSAKSAYCACVAVPLNVVAYTVLYFKLAVPILYVLVASGTTPIELNLKGFLVSEPSFVSIAISPALVLPVFAPIAIAVQPVPFSSAASKKCV